MAGTMIVNADMEIIDGHSRKKDLEAQGVLEVWVSVPSRQLTKKEYDEFNALYDIAKAGTPDMPMMEEVISEELMEEMELEKEEKQKGSALKYLELKPYVKTHVLLSFPPEKMIHIQPLLQKIVDIDGVEYEQSSN